MLCSEALMSVIYFNDLYGKETHEGLSEGTCGSPLKVEKKYMPSF